MKNLKTFRQFLNEAVSEPKSIVWEPISDYDDDYESFVISRLGKNAQLALPFGDDVSSEHSAVAAYDELVAAIKGEGEKETKVSSADGKIPEVWEIKGKYLVINPQMAGVNYHLYKK